jgi:hypothetical protein
VPRVLRVSHDHCAYNATIPNFIPLFAKRLVRQRLSGYA